MDAHRFVRWRWILLLLVLLGVLVTLIFLRRSHLAERYEELASDTAADESVVLSQGDADLWPELGMGQTIGGLERPVHITHAADGSGRIFVVEQAGRIRIIQDGEVLPEPFLDIVPLVSCCGERGLLSVAFPPNNGKSPQHFYIDYTDSNGDTVIARYQVSGDPNQADPDSAEVLLNIAQPYGNHNGGQLVFGPDGYLYIGMGDGGSAGDPHNNAQNPGVLLGKMLRIDTETEPADPSQPYAIPDTNPFVQTEGYRPEIWALGLRNPWRFSFDRATGDLYIGDVGQDAYEEIDFQPAESDGGENYGWRCKEGFHDFNMAGCEGIQMVLPVAEYRNRGYDCSVTGGFVYRGGVYERMQGVYFYGDYCSGKIWGLQQQDGEWINRLLLESSAGRRLTTFGEDEQGNLYIADLEGGTIMQLVDTNPS
jgi:glucose/arabinose dehydrogenase